MPTGLIATCIYFMGLNLDVFIDHIYRMSSSEFVSTLKLNHELYKDRPFGFGIFENIWKSPCREKVCAKIGWEFKLSTLTKSFNFSNET